MSWDRRNLTTAKKNKNRGAGRTSRSLDKDKSTGHWEAYGEFHE